MKKLFCVLLFLVRLSSLSWSQDMVSLMNGYNVRVPQEKLFIHFDNSVYTPGQTLFYKAYLQNSNRSAAASTNLYLDFYDERGELVSKVAAPVYGLTASGSYDIPLTCKGNTLRVLAYTKWMLNFDSAFLFQRTFKLVQRTDMNHGVLPNTAANTTLGFYPEGGDLVEGLTSQVAFRAVDAKGMPARVSGRIISQNKITVAEFTTAHNGMGKFSLKPVAGETYSAEWKDAMGIHTTALPVAKKTGVVLTVNNTSVQRSVSIERTAGAEDRFKKMMLVATMNQQVLFRGGANMLAKEKLDVDIPTGRFPSGVLQLTLFDANMAPMAERITFINNHEYRKDVSIATDTLRLVKKGANTFHIVMPDTLLSLLSLSITDADDANDTTTNILSQLLLSSDIRGKVFNPASYFSSSHDSIASQLDLVMLTNGWRRFVWDDVFKGSSPKLQYGPDVNFISVEGNISGLKLKKPQMMNVLLNRKDSSQLFLPAELDTAGHFMMDKITAFDTSMLYYRINDMRIPKNSEVKIKNNLWEFDREVQLAAIGNAMVDTAGNAKTRAILNKQDELDRLKKQTTLQEVVVRSTRIQVLQNRHVRGTAFQDTSRSQSFNVLDDSVAKTYPTLEDYLWRQRIPGVSVSGMPLRLRRLDGKQIAIYINESSADQAMLAALTMDQIALIKWFPPPFMDGGDLGGGAFAIYLVDSRDYKDMKVKPPSRLKSEILAGYSPVKEFYSPFYNESQLSLDEPDLRRTLLWQPGIEAGGANNRVRVSFFNNVSVSRYWLRLRA